MFEYNFNYNTNTIKVTIDVFGHEQVFVNNERVSSSWKWTLSNKHSILVDDAQLLIEVKVRSLVSGQIQVSLFQGDNCIEAQVQTFSMSNKNVTLSDDELMWQTEISIGSSYTVLANILYFSLLCFGLLMNAFPESPLSQLYFIPVMITTLLAVGLFIKDGVAMLGQKETTGSTEFKEG